MSTPSRTPSADVTASRTNVTPQRVPLVGSKRSAPSPFLRPQSSPSQVHKKRANADTPAVKRPEVPSPRETSVPLARRTVKSGIHIAQQRKDTAESRQRELVAQLWKEAYNPPSFVSSQRRKIEALQETIDFANLERQMLETTNESCY